MLSEATEKYDRSIKFQHYRKVSSLRQYVPVSQYRPHVDFFMLNERGEWVVGSVTGLDDVLDLGPIGMTLPLADVYEGVSVNTNEDVLHEDQ